MKQTLDISLILAVLAQFVAIGFFIWRVSAVYSELKTKIERNHTDINSAANSIREDLRGSHYVLQSQITHLQEHLSRSDNYHPPSLRNWNKDWDN